MGHEPLNLAMPTEQQRAGEVAPDTVWERDSGHADAQGRVQHAPVGELRRRVLEHLG
jgi:hypothetical protein